MTAQWTADQSTWPAHLRDDACRYAAVWAVAFLALLAYWQTYEAVEPGTQYADPLWPCAWLATWPAHLWLTVKLIRAR